jgi:hypothetical protein
VSVGTVEELTIFFGTPTVWMDEMDNRFQNVSEDILVPSLLL